MKQINYIYALIIFLSYFSQSNGHLKQNNDFRYRFPVCNKYNCPRSRGICTRDNKCICLKNYITNDLICDILNSEKNNDEKKLLLS